MISELRLKEICEKYEINYEALMSTNPNILDKGDFINICQVLDYLRDELNIAPSNIEKCPSILYRGVSNIKSNYEFLKMKKINIKNVESCLHVLGTDSDQLENTYEYVEKNYGVKAINRITSILRVNVQIIKDVEGLNLKFDDKNGNLTVANGIEFRKTTLEEVEKILNSEEFKKYPELFTSTTLAHTKIEDIREIIHSEEFKEHPELFTSQTLARAKIEDIREVIHSEEFKKYPELFTSQTLAHAKIEDIREIIYSEEFKEHPELFTSTTLADAKVEDIRKIIHSEEFKEHPELFTSTTLANAKIEDIRKMINSEEFKEHPELFTSETLARAKIEDIREIIHSEEFKEHPELFTSQTLARAKIEDIRDIIQSEEFKAHPELFTSQTLAHAKIEDIRDIIHSEEFKAHPELFTSETLAHAKIEDLREIINSEEFKEHPELFTSTTLARTKIEDIREILSLDYWKDERFKKLLTSSVLAKGKVMIKKLPKLIKLAELYEIDKNLNTKYVLKSPSQNYALIRYLQDSNQALIVNGKLNLVFSYQPGELQKRYGIDLKALMEIYVLDENELEKKSGFEDCINDDKIRISDVKKVKGEILKIEEQENIESTKE